MIWSGLLTFAIKFSRARVHKANFSAFDESICASVNVRCSGKKGMTRMERVCATNNILKCGGSYAKLGN